MANNSELSVTPPYLFRGGGSVTVDPFADFGVILDEPFFYADGLLNAVSAGFWSGNFGLDSCNILDGHTDLATSLRYSANTIFFQRNISFGFSLTMPFTTDLIGQQNVGEVLIGSPFTDSSMVGMQVNISLTNGAEYEVRKRISGVSTLVHTHPAGGANRVGSIYTLNGGNFDLRMYIGNNLIHETLSQIPVSALFQTPIQSTNTIASMTTPRGVERMQWYTMP